MLRSALVFLAVAVLLVAGAANAQPVKFDLVPIADDMPGISGSVSIECNTITGTVFTCRMLDLPLNDFSVVLHGAGREDFVVGTMHVVTRGETISVFTQLIDCPIPNYDQIRLMNGTRLIMFGNLH